MVCGPWYIAAPRLIPKTLCVLCGSEPFQSSVVYEIGGAQYPYTVGSVLACVARITPGITVSTITVATA